MTWKLRSKATIRTASSSRSFGTINCPHTLQRGANFLKTKWSSWNRSVTQMIKVSPKKIRTKHFTYYNCRCFDVPMKVFDAMYLAGGVDGKCHPVEVLAAHDAVEAARMKRFTSCTKHLCTSIYRYLYKR